jgi:hypothetical protein
MHLHAPERPRYANGTPLLVLDSGKAVGPHLAVPAVYVTPLEGLPDGYELQMLAPAATYAAFTSLRMPWHEGLDRFFALWREDPEGVLWRVFKYKVQAQGARPTAAAAPLRKVTTTLADLGL